MVSSKLFLTPPPLKPIFSHTPGIRVALFGSNALLRCYPTKIDIETDPLQGSSQILFQIPLPFKGPISDWIVKRYLNKPLIEIEGRDIDGHFFRFHLLDQENLIIFLPIKGFTASYKEERFQLPHSSKIEMRTECRLDLGGYRDHSWEKIGSFYREPNDMREVLQLLISSIAPKKPDNAFYEKESLLGELIKIAESEQKVASKKIFFLLKGIFESSFSGIFSLYPKDLLHLGYREPLFPEGYSTREILQFLSYAIQKMAGSYSILEKERLFFSPLIRSLFPSGRFWNLFLHHGEYILSYEWRKERPRRVSCITNSDTQILFDYGMKIQEYSIRARSLSAKKKREKEIAPLSLKAGVEYLCDSFLF